LGEDHHPKLRQKISMVAGVTAMRSNLNPQLLPISLRNVSKPNKSMLLSHPQNFCAESGIDRAMLR
jgi:hypothetical protein